MHIISKIAHVHLLSNHAFTGVINARQMRVTNVAHQHIQMTGETINLLRLALLFYSTIQLSHICRQTGHTGKLGLLLQYNASLTVCICVFLCTRACVCVCVSVRTGTRVCVCVCVRACMSV
jgi:hypothetical protein